MDGASEREQEVIAQCEVIRAELMMPEADDIPWATVTARTLNEMSKLLLDLKNMKEEIPKMTKVQLEIALEVKVESGLQVPLQLAPKLLENLEEHTVCSKAEIINLLRTINKLDPEATIFDQELYKGEAYNMVTYVLGESLAKEVQKDGRAGTRTRRKNMKVKKLEMLKESMETGLMVKAGGGGPTGCSKQTPVVARQVTTVPRHFKKKWLIAHHRQTRCGVTRPATETWRA